MSRLVAVSLLLISLVGVSVASYAVNDELLVGVDATCSSFHASTKLPLGPSLYVPADLSVRLWLIPGYRWVLRGDQQVISLSWSGAWGNTPHGAHLPHSSR